MQVMCGSSEPQRLRYLCGGDAGAARAVRGNVWCEWRKQFGPGKPGGSADAPETSKSAVG